MGGFLDHNMLLSKLEKQIELGKKLASAMNWDISTLNFSLGSKELQLSFGRSYINISERSNIKNKICNVDVSDYATNKRAELLKYKKPPEDTKIYPKQRISKDRLFNYSLEMNVVISHDELNLIEEVMDEYENIIMVSIFLRSF